MQAGIGGDQRAPLPVRGIHDAIGGLEPEAGRASRAPAKRHPEIASDRHLFRTGGWTQSRHGWLRGCQGIGPKPQVRPERRDDYGAAEAQQDGPAPPDRFDRLFLLEQVNDSKVEAVTDGDCVIDAFLYGLRPRATA